MQCVGVSPTNKLFMGGENGRQDKGAVLDNPSLLSCWHRLAHLITCLFLNTLEAHRKMTGRKYTKTITATFSNDGEIATNLIFFICFFYFPRCLQWSHMTFVIRKGQCIRNQIFFFEGSEISESFRPLKSLCLVSWTLHSNLGVKRRVRSTWEKLFL